MLKILLLVCSLSLSSLLLAQDAKLPFSERTGIKGINLQIGFTGQKYSLLKDGSIITSNRYCSLITREFNTSRFNEVSFQQRKSNLMPSLRAELVLAPFRLSPKRWKRNIEWTHGVFIQSYQGDWDILGVVDSSTYKVHYYRRVNMNLTQLNYQTNVFFNFLLTGSTMLYGGLGGGAGIPLTGYLAAGELRKYRFEWDGYRFLYRTYEFSGTGETINTSNFNLHTYASAGIKAHISCRINLNLEFAFQGTFHHMTYGGFLPDYRTGLTLGMRYKFNRPPDEDGEGGENEEKPFW